MSVWFEVHTYIEKSVKQEENEADAVEAERDEWWEILYTYMLVRSSDGIVFVYHKMLLKYLHIFGNALRVYCVCACERVQTRKFCIGNFIILRFIYIIH